MRHDISTFSHAGKSVCLRHEEKHNEQRAEEGEKSKRERGKVNSSTRENAMWAVEGKVPLFIEKHSHVMENSTVVDFQLLWKVLKKVPSSVSLEGSRRKKRRSEEKKSENFSPFWTFYFVFTSLCVSRCLKGIFTVFSPRKEKEKFTQ